MNCLPTDARTLCEIDTAHGWSKGNAFRLFKRLAESAREGQDYWVFPPHSSEFTALRARLYPRQPARHPAEPDPGRPTFGVGLNGDKRDRRSGAEQGLQARLIGGESADAVSQAVRRHRIVIEQVTECGFADPYRQ